MAFSILQGESNRETPYRLHYSLSLLSSEVLSRALNALFEDERYKQYGLPKWSRNINHLAYADDTILFTSTAKGSLDLVMTVLKDYQQASSQLINNQKSSFYMYRKVSNVLMDEVKETTGFNQGKFPFVYLGCPITHAKKRKADYNEIIKKVKGRLQNWKGKLLSYGDSYGAIKMNARVNIGYLGI